MITVTGETIYWNGHCVAIILARPSTIRDDFEAAINGDEIVELTRERNEWQTFANELEQKIEAAQEALK